MDITELRTELVRAMLAGDVPAARGIVDAPGDPDAAVIDLVAPALHDVGSCWAAGRIGIADEHVASATAAIALEHLAERHVTAPAGGRLAVVACVDGELHALGARAFADALERHGWRVLFCGASTPTRALADLAAERGAGMVALSVARRELLHAAAHAAAALHALSPRPLVVVGGQACLDAGDCPEADVVHVGPDARPLLRRLAVAA